MRIARKYPLAATVLMLNAVWTVTGHAERHGPPQNPAFRQAFEACIRENGLTKPSPGQRPSEADRKVIDTCLASKGFTPPTGHPPGPPPEGTSNQSPPTE